MYNPVIIGWCEEGYRIQKVEHIIKKTFKIPGKDIQYLRDKIAKQEHKRPHSALKILSKIK
jgi:hypothetical protein